ncbi:thiol peroxidase [bacterium]|nr:thiol peroxidase [candidate division CSSED10-310 bacterium]
MMKRQVTMHGNPLNLQGEILKVGDKAPDFIVVDKGLAPKTLADYAGKKLVLSAVPSLDTPVCDMETRTFNKLAADLGPDVKILTISMDLPFAQARWCGAAGIDQVETLSDHARASFGTAYGVLIENLRLLARSVFVVDRDGIIRYIELVPEITREPDYDKILEQVKMI